MSTTSAAPAGGEKASLGDWLAVSGALFGSFMAIIDILITNASLRQIEGSLGAGVDEGSWISTGYLIAECIVIPITGWLASVFSVRLYLVGSALAFVGFSVLCGLSTSLPEMIAFRVGQGFSGGALIPTAFTLVATRLPPSQRSIGLVLFGVSASLAPAIGPSLGGWLTEWYGWRYIFYINIVPGLALASMILIGLKPQPMNLGKLRNGDWFGIAAMAIGLGSLEIVLEEGQRKDWLGSQFIVYFAIAAAAGLVVAVINELTVEHPFLNIRLLRGRAFASICICSMIVGIVMFSVPYILPIYLGQIRGYNSLQIGQLMLWQGISQFLLMPFIPLLMRKFDLRLVIGTGFVIFAISVYLNVTLSADAGEQQLRLALIGRGLGVPMIMTPMTTLMPGAVDPRYMADASSIYNAVRNLGGSIGIAMLSTFSTMREHFHFSVIAERMGSNSPLLQDRLGAMTAAMMPDAATPALAQPMALGQLAGMVRRDALVMAYGDSFFIMTFLLLATMVFIPFVGKLKGPAAPGGGH